MVGVTPYKVWVVVSCKVLPEMNFTQEIVHFSLYQYVRQSFGFLDAIKGDLKTLKTCPVSAPIDIRMLVLYITLVTVLIDHLF